jgi:hypothetical protein
VHTAAVAFIAANNNYKQTQRVANTKPEGSVLLGAFCAEISVDGALGERRGFQNALGIQLLPDLEQGPRRADRVPRRVHAFISRSSSLLPVPAQIHAPCVRNKWLPLK